MTAPTTYTAADDGKFSYGGGHMEKHASLNGLGDLNNVTLAAEIRGQVGTDIALTYVEPQLAGGIATTARDYATLLQKIVRGDLKMHDALGNHPVCTNPATCANAAFTPQPAGRELALLDRPLGRGRSGRVLATAPSAAPAPSASIRGSIEPRRTTACWRGTTWAGRFRRSTAGG